MCHQWLLELLDAHRVALCCVCACVCAPCAHTFAAWAWHSHDQVVCAAIHRVLFGSWVSGALCHLGRTVATFVK
jgi:hypothetical protein